MPPTFLLLTVKAFSAVKVYLYEPAFRYISIIQEGPLSLDFTHAYFIIISLEDPAQPGNFQRT